LAGGIGARTIGACASLLCVAAAPGGSVRTTVQVSATVIRPSSIEVTTAGPDRATLRIGRSEAVNVKSSSGTICRLSDGTLDLTSASSTGTLFFTLEY
jgi:hypothetical protein